MKITELIEQKRKAKKRLETRNKVKTATTGVVAGTAIGALAALLFAPKSGKETREDIKNASKKTVGTVNEKYGQAKEEVSLKCSEAKQKINEYLEAKKKTKDISEDIEIEAREEVAAQEESEVQ